MMLINDTQLMTINIAKLLIIKGITQNQIQCGFMEFNSVYPVVHKSNSDWKTPAVTPSSF